jgi:hypothetical protein
MTNVTTSPDKLIPARVQLDALNQRRLVILESLTVLFLVALTFWSVGPLIEEWGLLRALNENGLGYIKTFAPSIPMRPFHLVAYALQWVLGAGHPVGVAAGTSVLLVARYLITRWAVSPFLSGYERWVVSVLAATLAFWPGVWLGRYGSAQLSAVLFFVALGFSVRLYQRWSITSALGCVASVVIMLATYQGLTLCLIAIPFASLLWASNENSANRFSCAIKSLRIGGTIALGFALYAAYWIFISSKMGNAGYEGSLAGDSARLFTIAGLAKHVETAYVSAFGQEAHSLPLMLLLVFFMCGNSITKLSTIMSRVFWSVLAFCLVVLLPFLSLIYVNALHIRDLDRVLFPVSAGIVLVCISLLNRFRGAYSSNTSFNAHAVVVMLLVSSVLVALDSRHYVNVQRSVLSQTWDEANKVGAKSAVIRDMTGTLGDVYTLFSSSPNDALAVLGMKLTVTICTPLSVDRLHPVAQRFPITSTVRCEDLPPPTDSPLILYARWKAWDDNTIVVAP